MPTVFDLHAAALRRLPPDLPIDGPLPGPPTGFLRAWLDAATGWCDAALADRLRQHYAVDSTEAWVQRFYQSPRPVLDLLRLDLRHAPVPRLRHTLDRLFTGARAAGLSPEATWGAHTAADLLDQHPRPLDLHATAFFGCCQPLVSLGPAEQRALTASADAGWSPAELLDTRLAGHLVHELAHGPDRPWRGGPASWMLHEAAAAVVNHDCFAGHVLAERPGEPVLGLRNALVLGTALVEAFGTHAVWRLALTASHPTDVIGPRLAHALTAVDWQLWARARPAAFMPVHERLLAWSKLVDLALADPHLLPALSPLEQTTDVTPDLALAAPDLLAAADAVPWHLLPAWHAPLTDALRAALDLAVRSLWHSERLQPDLQAVPTDPPRGEVHLTIAACALHALPRADDPHGQPLAWRMPPALCRALHQRGLHQLVVRGNRWGHQHELTERLWDLSTGIRPLPRHLDLDLRDPGPLAAPARHTPVRTTLADRQLHHTDPIVTLGSCFATHIGERLHHAGFEVYDNPFGILYDPFSVARALDHVAAQTPLPEDLLFFAHGRWHSPWHHTQFSDPDRDHIWTTLQAHLRDAWTARDRPGTWLLTWGTAWVWEQVHDGQIVANCHGLPTERFRCRLLTVEQIVERTAASLAALQQHAPGVQIVLTLSPIRHLAQGMVGNQRSKATLHLAAQQLHERSPNLRYFPAYELVLDELRDYRWYLPDHVHLTPAAADQVYERFLDTFVAPASRTYARQVRDLHQRLVETPRDPLRAEAALHDLLTELDELPRSPALPRPHQLRTSITHTHAAQRDLLGAASPTTRAAPVTLKPTAPSPAPPPPSASLADLERALRRGTFIGWEALPAWSDEVRDAVARLTSRAPDGNELSWRALEALLDKLEELEVNTAVAAIAEPLIADLLRRYPMKGSRPDTWARLGEVLAVRVPRGELQAGEEVLRAGGEEGWEVVRACIGGPAPHP